MKWARERELLIAQTMTFVQSVTGKKPEAEARAETRIDSTPVDEIERRDRTDVSPVAGFSQRTPRRNPGQGGGVPRPPAAFSPRTRRLFQRRAGQIARAGGEPA